MNRKGLCALVLVAAPGMLGLASCGSEATEEATPTTTKEAIVAFCARAKALKCKDSSWATAAECETDITEETTKADPKQVCSAQTIALLQCFKGAVKCDPDFQSESFKDDCTSALNKFGACAGLVSWGCSDTDSGTWAGTGKCSCSTDWPNADGTAASYKIVCDGTNCTCTKDGTAYGGGPQGDMCPADPEASPNPEGNFSKICTGQ